MSARDRHERFNRAVAQGRAAFDAGQPYESNPYKPVGLVEQQHQGTHTTGAGISHGAWCMGWSQRKAEMTRQIVTGIT